MDLREVRPEHRNLEREGLYRQAILVAIGGNALLAGAKGLIAWFSGSSALFSDAANSLTDTLYSLLMGIGLYLSQRPADRTHPQGHSRFEPLVSLLIALAMGAAGITAISQSVDRFLGGSLAIKPGWPTVVLVGAMILKIGMYFFVRRIGDESESPAIRATAKDNLIDVLVSGAALAGVWGSKLIHPVLDPVAGALVGLWIFRATWEITRENLGYLTGRGVSRDLIQRIVQSASQVKGVKDVHRVVADHVGPQVRVDMHINVSGEISLREAHDISESVRESVENLQGIDLVFVHVEPLKKK